MESMKVKKHELVVKRFYEALAEGKILSVRCKRCGAYEFPPVYTCNSCSGTDMEWAEISGEAKLLDFVLPGPATAKPENAHLMPYGVGSVQLKEGPSIPTLILGISEENSKDISRQLPVPVKAETVQREGYKGVVFRIKK